MNKRKKPPTMPHWFWLAQDGCWFCKYQINQKGCHNCSINKAYRKEFFEKKIKGRNYGKRGTKTDWRKEIEYD